MDYSKLRQLVSESSEPFFAAWELTEPPSSEWSSFVPFLRLLKTEAIFNWATGFSPVKNDRRWTAAVMPVLLERHVLLVAHRRRPEIIGDFWREAVWFSPALARLWEEAELPATLDPELSIAQQEEHFADALRQAADKVEQELGPDHWAVNTLQRLARKRGLLGRKFADNAEAHVVFGFDQPPVALRSGLIVPFRLLAPHGREIDIRTSHVFAKDFLDALREDVFLRTPHDELRSLDHDWDFLGAETLTGTSGTMAIWLAQFLAGGGLRDNRWTLPPWVLVTATLNRQGDGTGGAAGTVGLLRSKVEIALEEGVRVLVVASETGATDDIARELGDLPGFADLTLLPVRAGEHDVADIAREVRERQLCWAVRLDSVPGDLHKPTSEEEQELIEGRLLPQHVVSDSDSSELSANERSAHARESLYERRLRELSEDYVPPTRVLQRIEAARQELPGCGYIHITAPPMSGKSHLILALKHGWKRSEESAALGHTLGYAILHGRPENPADFLHDVFVQAKQQAGERAFAEFHTPPHQQRTDDDTRRAVRDMLAVAHQSRALSGRPLMLAIDALDEITADDKDSNRSSILDYLPRADELPQGCYLLLTSRPELRPKVWKSLAARVGSEFKEIGVTLASEVSGASNGIAPTPYYRSIDFEIDNEHRQLLREFLLASFGKLIQPHLDTILERSEERFLYVRLIRDLLRLQMKERGDAVLRDLKPGDLPNADEVFPAYLNFLAHTSDNNLFNRWHRPVLLLIAAAYEPITHDHLRCWLDIRDSKDDRENHPLNLALDSLSPLLLIDRPPDLPNTSRFTVAHRELLDWFQTNSHSDWLAALRDEGHHRIVESSRQRTLPAALAHFVPIDVYHLLHIPSHCLDMGKTDAAWDHLANLDAVKVLDELAMFYNNRWQWPQVITVWDCRIQQIERLVPPQSNESDAHSVVVQKHVLATAYMNRGFARQGRLEFTKSVTDYVRATTLFEALLTAFGGPVAAVRVRPALVNSLAGVYTNRGSVHAKQLAFAQAEEYFNRAIELFEVFLTVYGNPAVVVRVRPEEVNGLAHAYLNRGCVRHEQKEFVLAVADHNRAIELLEPLLTESVIESGGMEEAAKAQPKRINGLAAAYMNRGNAYSLQKEFSKAEADYCRAIELREVLRSAFGGLDAMAPTQPELVKDLAAAYMNRGTMRDDQKSFALSLADHGRATELYEALLASFGGLDSAVQSQPELVMKLAVAYLNRENAIHGQRASSKAVTDYDQAIRLFEALLTACGGIDSAVLSQPALVNNLAIAHVNRGNRHRDQQEFSKAVADYNRAIGLREVLLTAFDEANVAQPALIEDLIGVYRNRCLVCFSQQEFDLAVAGYDRVVVLSKRLLATLGGIAATVIAQPELIENLAGAYINRGSARLIQQEFALAVADDDEAISLLEQLLAVFDDLSAVVAAQPTHVISLAGAYLNRALARLGQQDLAGAVADYDLTISLREALLSVMQQSVLGDYLGAISARLMFSVSLKDEKGFVVTVMRALSALIQLYQVIGPAIRLPGIKPHFEFLNNCFAKITQFDLPDAMRTAWDELRALFAQE